MTNKINPLESENSEARLLAGIYNGDKKALKEDIAKSRSETIKWQDLDAASKIHPELEPNVQVVIALFLGYLPPAYLTLPQEAFLRLLVHSFRQGNLSIEEYMAQAEEHIKIIRNQEMKENGHHRLVYWDHVQRQHAALDTQVLENARKRITRFLNYMPPIDITLSAEILLSTALMAYPVEFTDEMNSIDIQALTIIRFREVLFAQGNKAALQSPLVARDFSVTIDPQIL